ncbi:MAG: FtsX-like permease family protein [Planctomycetes bacterium]|nr:FtsX-like permease family protein [Planctomycetota bacterium]
MRTFRLIFDSLVWRYQRQDGVRVGVTLLGVALGVSVVVAIRLANRSVLESFRDSVDRVAGRANLQIAGDGFPFDERILEQLEWLLPLAEIAPAVTGTVTLRDRPQEVLEILGVDLLRDGRARDYRLLRPAATGEKEGRVEHLLRLLTERDGLLLAESLARRIGVSPGDFIEVLVDDRGVRLHVMDLLADEGLGRAMSGNLALMDIASAQWLFRKFGQVDRVDLVVRDPRRVNAIAERLQAEMPAAVRVGHPSMRTRQVESMISAYQLNLTALSWIALFVGIFLVYNTVSIAVLRRRREIGIIRALGAPRGLVVLAFAFEAAAFGLLGAALGSVLGWLLALGSVRAAARTASSFYERVVVEPPGLDAETAVLGLVTGLGLALLAGFVPVREAASVSPAEALRTGSLEFRRRGRARPYALAGLAFLLLAAWAACQPPLGRKPVFGFLSAFLVILGFSLLAPLAIQAAAGFLQGPFSRWFGFSGCIATAGLPSSLGRTSVTVAALTIGLAMTVGMGILIDSFRRTVGTWVDQTVRCDLWIKAGSSQRLEGRIYPETIEKIARVQGVREIDPYRELFTTYRGEPIILGSGRFEIAARHSNLPIQEGGTSAEALRRGQQRGACIVSESFSTRFQLRMGDALTLATPSGPLSLTIAAVYYEYSNERGYVLIDWRTFLDHYQDPTANVVSLYLDPGEDIFEVRERILREVGQETPLIVRTTAALREEILRIFDRTFAVTRGLQVIAIIVAVLGIVNTQVALVFERKREIAILRYLGAATRQVRRIVMLEAGILGLVGVVLGTAAGIALAAVLIFVINKQSFGWTIQAHFPALYVGFTSALVLLAAVVAGIYPASLACRVNASEALRAE